jgi:hypothetical protein
METKHTIFAQKNVKNNLNLDPNSMRVSRKESSVESATEKTIWPEGDGWTRPAE